MPKAERREEWRDRLTHGAPLAVLLAAGLFIGYQWFTILLPILELIVLAMLLALVLRTAVNGLERLGASSWLAVVLMLLGVGALGALVVLVIVPNVTREVQMLINNRSSYLESLKSVLQSLPFMPDLSQVIDRLQDLLSQLVSQLPSLAMDVASLLGGVLAVVFLALYMAANPYALVSGTLRLVPEGRREPARQFLDTLGERLRGWIVGVILVALFIGTGGGLGLWILGVPLPLTFGLIAGLLNVIPFLGSIVGGLLPALVALTISPTKALLVVALFIILNQIEGNVLQPLIMGRQVRLNPAAILISFLILGTLLGYIIGALLAVPTAVFVGVLLDELTSKEPSSEGKESSVGEESERKSETGSSSA
jgi:predicted PurR-regulated permease PerM